MMLWTSINDGSRLEISLAGSTNHVHGRCNKNIFLYSLSYYVSQQSGLIKTTTTEWRARCYYTTSAVDAAQINRRMTSHESDSIILLVDRALDTFNVTQRLLKTYHMILLRTIQINQVHCKAYEQLSISG